VIPNELSETIILQAEGIFDELTEDERLVVRFHAEGHCYPQIAAAMGKSVSSVKSSIARACRKKNVNGARLDYLVGLHDARAHSAALREDTVHVVVTRNGITRLIEI
jgi:DNA-binding NarL/FixJ family response regulator